MSTEDEFLQEFRLLQVWLIEDAYPTWWREGADHVRGGFHERLSLDGQATNEPRRCRLHPRQIYSFAAAEELGWQGPAAEAVKHGIDYFVAHYFRSDGLVRTLVDVNGKPLDESAALYDQTFGLLGFASAFEKLRDERWLEHARSLRNEIISAFGRPIGFEERLNRSPPLLANSHMHLLEACLAWRELDEKGWYDIASNIVELAIDRMLHPQTHVITEFFDHDWKPLPSELGRLVEPGHLFEWGWLLLRWAAASRDGPLERHALRLIDVAEHGVHSQRQVVMNGLALTGDTLVVRDARARLWPQTERIKALVLAGRMTNDSRYVVGATRALRTLRQYLSVPTPGLWCDMMNADGNFVAEPAPASSLYHIVAAARECARYLRKRSSAVASG